MDKKTKKKYGNFEREDRRKGKHRIGRKKGFLKTGLIGEQN